MEVLFKQQQFNDAFQEFIEQVREDTTRDPEIAYALEAVLLYANRFYNQIQDWNENPELAQANCHHDKEDLKYRFQQLFERLKGHLETNNLTFNSEAYVRFKH